MSKNMNVPKLRFSEFGGEWEDKLFGNIVTNKSKKYNPEKETISYKCIELEHLSTENGQLLGYIDSLNSGSIKNKFNKNDVLFGKLRPYLKKYLLSPFDGVCSSEIWVLNGTNITNSFLYYIVQSDYFIGLANQSSGSKMPRADWNIIENSIFFIPSKPEQEKIASFLTSVDTKIEQLTKKEALLQEYKKGVMSKIFNQEIRFKDEDGSKFPEWEDTELGNILIENKEKTTINNQYDVLSSTKDDIVLQSEYFNREIASKDNIGYKVLKKNQLVFSPQNLWLGNININTKYEVGMVSPSYKIYNIEEKIILINYLKYIIKTPEMMFNYEQASEQGASVVRRSLNIDLFNIINISIPSLEEQTKIANFLSSIDKKIDLTTKELNSTKEFKKALLQQMFI